MDYFLQIAQLQEQLKSYYVALTYDTEFAGQLLREINEKRIAIALDAELREIFWAEQSIIGDATPYQRSYWFSKNDIEYALRRGVCNLAPLSTISAVNQGNSQRIITREPMRWQNLFSQVQRLAVPSGQQIPFDFPQEMRFTENESLGIAIQGQDEAGQIFYHGCTFKDALEDATRRGIEAEISSYLPEPQYVPIVYLFENGTGDERAVDPSGSDQIFSAKNSRSVLLTHVSVSDSYHRLTIIDEGRNQMLCENVAAAGIAGWGESAYSVFYPLPYPHLLRRGDRLRIYAVNGSSVYDGETSEGTTFLTFKGFSI